MSSARRFRAQDELALETARLEMSVRLGDPIEGDPLGDARLNGASCQQAEELLQVLPEAGGMTCPQKDGCPGEGAHGDGRASAQCWRGSRSGSGRAAFLAVDEPIPLSELLLAAQRHRHR